MSLVGIIDYQTLGMILDDVSDYFYSYKCGECNMKCSNSKNCNNCENNSHFHKTNCISIIFRKIFKCKKCKMQKCFKCNVTYNKNDTVCHDCKTCHKKNKLYKFCKICNKCVNPYIHNSNKSFCVRTLKNN